MNDFIIPKKAFDQHMIALGKTGAGKSSAVRKELAPEEPIIFGPRPATTVPTDLDKAYAAGFFDGEGNVTIAVNWQGGARRKYPVYNMRLSATQNDLGPLLWLRERWGGSIIKIKRSAPCNGHQWYCFSRGAYRFLKDVYPFLKVKHDQALVAMWHQFWTEQRGRCGRTPERLEELRRLKEMMTRLNAHPRAESAA